MSDLGPIDAVTLDFYETLVWHRDGRGRGRVLVEYLETRGLEPAPWEHQVLYDVFERHDEAYSPHAPLTEREAYHAALAARVFDRLGIRASPEAAEEHAAGLWQILGPACLGVYPDVFGALRALRSSGMPLAIISNWQCGLRHFCAELGVSSFFDHILGSADLGMAKPSEGIFLEACTRLGVPPERTLHVGDTLVDDYHGGRSAGVRVALIDRRAEVDDDDVRVIHSLDELPRLVA